MTKIKIPLIFFITALLLSFLIGLISGVSFLSILLRSFVLAVITGFFVAGVRELLERFTPELFALENQDVSEANSSTGKTVDINIDDPIDLNENIQVETTKNYNDAEEILSDTKDDGEDIRLDAASLGDEMNGENSLEELPDLQEFIPDEIATDEAEGTDFTQVGTGKFDVSAQTNDPVIDTNIMTQAVKTVLRRED